MTGADNLRGLLGRGALFGLAWITAALSGCDGTSDRQQVVLYTSLNEPTARAVVDAFEQETGIRVIVQADTERDKTVGLVQMLIEEKSRPRADVFWNSEAANTVRLQREGVLEPLDPPPAGYDRIPAEYRDPDGYWFGFSGRARILIVNTELVGDLDMPTSMWDLLDPKWRGKAALVRPVTGTTLTHVTALYELLGDEQTNRFLDGVQENECHLPPGNGRLAQLVGQGAIAFGFTDTSDFRLVRHEGHPVIAVYPDQDSIGTLLIPNTVAKVRGGPNPENARTLIEFLLSDRAEAILAHHPRGHIPLKPDIDRPDEVIVPGDPPDGFRTMNVDYQRIGQGVAERLAELDQRFP
jgi:iron(III) transport system substrate-binding protein